MMSTTKKRRDKARRDRISRLTNLRLTDTTMLGAQMQEGKDGFLKMGNGTPGENRTLATGFGGRCSIR